MNQHLTLLTFHTGYEAHVIAFIRRKQGLSVRDISIRVGTPRRKDDCHPKLLKVPSRDAVHMHIQTDVGSSLAPEEESTASDVHIRSTNKGSNVVKYKRDEVGAFRAGASMIMMLIKGRSISKEEHQAEKTLRSKKVWRHDNCGQCRVLSVPSNYSFLHSI